MKRWIVISALAMAVTLGTSASAEAKDRWSFSFGFGSHGSQIRVGYGNNHNRVGHHRVGHSRHARRIHRHHRHVRVPRYRQVWIQPTYDTIVVGYDHHHRPIYRRVCVRQGYYRNDIYGYECGSCGKHF